MSLGMRINAVSFAVESFLFTNIAKVTSTQIKIKIKKMKVTKENEEKEKMCSNSQPGAIVGLLSAAVTPSDYY